MLVAFETTAVLPRLRRFSPGSSEADFEQIREELGRGESTSTEQK